VPSRRSSGRRGREEGEDALRELSCGLLVVVVEAAVGERGEVFPS